MKAITYAEAYDSLSHGDGSLYREYCKQHGIVAEDHAAELLANNSRVPAPMTSRTRKVRYGRRMIWCVLQWRDRFVLIARRGAEQWVPVGSVRPLRDRKVR